MKLFLPTLISVTCLIFTASSFAQQSASPPNAVISIESRHSGLPVFIDGKEAGFTPLQHLSVAPGKHEIAVKRLRPESWLDFDWVETCSLRAGDTLKLVARFQKGYSINSTPFGAEVCVNGVLQGTTPLVLRLLEGETTSVEIRKIGHRSEQLQIGKTPAGISETRLYAATLKPEKDLTAIHDSELSRRRLHVSRNRRISLATAGLSLASGVAAVLLKDKADHFYEQYLAASLPDKRERFYQRTENYDRYAGIATAVFEASFAVSFYFFLKSTAN